MGSVKPGVPRAGPNGYCWRDPGAPAERADTFVYFRPPHVLTDPAFGTGQLNSFPAGAYLAVERRAGIKLLPGATHFFSDVDAPPGHRRLISGYDRGVLGNELPRYSSSAPEFRGHK